MPVVLQNDTASTLRVGVAAGDTTLVVASGQGSRFPTLGVGDYFYATLEDTAGNKEIVEVTARTGDTLTATRGAESTTAREFPAGATIEMRVTAASVIDAAANAVSLTALGITASASELNILDGVTASTAELNRLTGVAWPLVDYNTLSSTVAELNLLDGVTWTLTNYNTLTASAAELNILDGVTASTAELNLLDGVTWTLTDYNTLTASAAELNALDGVTTVGTNIVRAADAAAQRTVLGLGDLAVLDTVDTGQIDDGAITTAKLDSGEQMTTTNVNTAIASSTVGGIGTYAFLSNPSGSANDPGETEAAANLRYFGIRDTQLANVGNMYGSAPAAGTWRCMGVLNAGSGVGGTGGTLWLRVA